jgi:selenide, water dikinase
MKHSHGNWREAQKHTNAEELNHSYNIASTIMSTPNLFPSQLLSQHKSKGCTDITGFGLLGHAKNLVSVQKEKVGFRFHSLPVISKTHTLSDLVIQYQYAYYFNV